MLIPSPVLRGTLKLLLFASPFAASASSPREILAEYIALAGRAADARLGRQFFVTRHASDWSCSSCHGEKPTQPGQHPRTGRQIAALAPAANADSFTQKRHAEKWFRRSCNEIVGRECTASEKADVLAWLMSLRP